MTHELFERAKVHMDRNEFDSAINCLMGHLNDDMWNPEAHMMLSACFLVKGHNGLAAVMAKQAAQGRPDFPEAWRNLGSAFKAEHKNAEAEKAWLLALDQYNGTLPREQAMVYGCLGTLHINEGSPQKALDYFDRGLKLDPGNPVLEYNRGLACLELGRWEEGWSGYDLRFAADAQRSRHYGRLPVWNGRHGQRVIVWGEQGIGDEILFASCMPDMIRACKKVIFDCHPRLVELFKRSFPEAEIHGTRKLQSGVEWYNEEVADSHVSISSLTTHFRQIDSDFPGKPFLKANRDDGPARTERRQRIGISWAGGTRRTRTDLRSIPLPRWLPILRALDADFFSLQYTDGAAREVCELEETTGVRVKHYPGWAQAKDYDKTASFVASMDLVITVCTAVHHLAGGLGVPTWTLVPTRPAWRYGGEGEACPWYGSVRLFRQPADDWSPVIERVVGELRNVGVGIAA